MKTALPIRTEGLGLPPRFRMTNATEVETGSRARPWWLVFIAGRNPRVTLIRAVVWALAAWLVFGFVLRPVKVDGISMEPTYRGGQINLLNRWSFKFSPPARGDVVGVKTTGESILYLKRIVGLPGERIRFERGRIYINDEPLEEPYLRNPAPWNEAELLLGPDEYFLVGDNRTMPARNHTHGAFLRSKLVGRVLL
jgi:signal peptidase I